MAKTFATAAKATIGSLLAGSMLLSAVPANAQRHNRHDDRIDAGDVIAGAVIVGGLAAILSAGNRDRYDDRYDDRYGGRYDGRYDRNGYGGDWRRYGSRQAVEQCVYAAEQRASRFGDADVRRVTQVDRIRGGYEVRGTIAVDERYGRYGRYDRRGYDDRGRFRCTVRYGQVQNLRLAGLG